VADRGGDCDDTNPVLTERGIYFDDALVEFDNGDTYTLPGDGDVTICKGTWNIRLVADGVTATISGVEGAATTNLSGGVEATPLTILDSTVTVEGLTILDGDSDGDGGCVYVDGSVASFTDVTVRNCEAVNGGAVYLTGSTVSMSNGGFRDNSVTGNGGSVFVEHGPLTLSNVIQSQSDAGSGGAVYVGEDGSVLASGGEVHDCEAADGGGIAVVGGTWSSSQTTIRANQAQANGGGFYVEDGDVTLVGGKLAANSGGEGGGVYVASGGGLVTTETDCAQGTSDNAPNDAKPAFGDAVSWDGTCTAVCDDSLCE
jgi:hypothetical protein